MRHLPKLSTSGVPDFSGKSRNHLKILGSRKVMCSMFLTENPQILSTKEHTLVASVTWHPGSVHL